MPRGRKPKPTTIKRAEGNPGKRKVNRHEPQPDSTMPPRPAELNEAAVAIWDHVAGELHGMGLLTAIDDAVLVTYCQSYATYLQLIRDVEVEGITVTHVQKNGVEENKINPKQVEARLLGAQLRAMASEYGLTPSARARLEIKPPNEEESKIKKFFREKAVNG